MKLCHYTSRTAALEHILPTRRLRFGTLPRTNDPREFLPIWFGIAGIVDENEPLTTRDPFVLSEGADELLRDSVRLLCFTEDLPSNRPLLRYGTGPRRSRMWAQYAENHTGVCLCFDGERLIDAAHEQLRLTPSSRTLMHERVRYALEGEYPARPPLLQPEAEADLPAYIEAMVSNHSQDLFFTKDWDWRDETEYRLLLRGKTTHDDSIDIRDALEGVIVGPSCHRVYWSGLCILCEELDAEPYVLQWETGEPLIVRIPDRYRGGSNN